MNTSTSKNIISIAIIGFLIIAIYLFLNKKTEAPTIVLPITAQEVKPQYMNASLSDIVISYPLPGATIPEGVLKVSGKARGPWYFEANAGIEIQDSNRNVLKKSYVMAIGEWMTTEFVPFQGEIAFTIPSGVTEGFIVFKNDNPSGDAIRDKEVRIPVVFK